MHFLLTHSGGDSLVVLSNEQFPRLRTQGRLIWLGDPRDDKFDYHDPECDTESYWSADAGCWIRLEDARRFSPRLPDGVGIAPVPSPDIGPS